MEDAIISAENNCDFHKARLEIDIRKMSHEKIDKSSKPKYCVNRSYAFDDLVNLFENLSTPRSIEDDSVFNERVTRLARLKNNSSSYPIDESSTSPSLNFLKEGRLDNGDLCDFDQRDSKDTTVNVSTNVYGTSTEMTITEASAPPYKSKNMKNSIRKFFGKSKSSSSQNNTTIENLDSKHIPKERRKLIVKEKLKICLHGLKNTTNHYTIESSSQISAADVFSEQNKQTFNVCGINFEVFKYNIGDSGKSKRVIITLHDIAHNSKSNFETFFSDEHLIDTIKTGKITVWHICSPGHSEIGHCAKVHRYPGFAELSKMITILVTEDLNIDRCIGVGIGAGGDLLLRSSLLAPSLYSHLVCVNVKLRSTDNMKVFNYPLIFNPINSNLKTRGIDYFESNSIKQFCATTVNIESLRNYKQFLKNIQKNPNISQLAMRYWKRPDIDYYSDETFRRLESIPKILVEPNVLLLEGLVNPDKNTKGDLLDFVYPGKRIYKSFDNGSKLVLEEYTSQAAKMIVKFINDRLN